MGQPALSDPHADRRRLGSNLMAQPAIPNPIKSSSMETGLTPRPAARAKDPGKEVPIADIVIKSISREYPGTDAQQYAAQLAVAEQRGMVKLLKMHNTVFLLKPLPNQTVELHTATIEAPDQVVERWQKVPNSLKQMGFKKLISYSENPAVNRLVQRTGLPVKISQSQRMLGDKMVPTFKYELDF
jgi:hypothetical protein